MLPNRTAAATQAIVVPIVMSTARHPIDVGFIHGPVTVALGAAYTLAAVVALVRPLGVRPAAWVAGIGATYWLLRALTLVFDGIEAHEISWAGIAIQILLAEIVALYYWRSIVRGSFLNRFNQIQRRLNTDG